MATVAPLGADATPSPQKVNPIPRLPSRPNLSRQPWEEEPIDYTVYLPSRKDEDTGPTYTQLNPTKVRRPV